MAVTNGGCWVAKCYLETPLEASNVCVVQGY